MVYIHNYLDFIKLLDFVKNGVQLVIHLRYALLDTVNLPLEPFHVFVIDVSRFQRVVNTNRFRFAL